MRRLLIAIVWLSSASTFAHADETPLAVIAPSAAPTSDNAAKSPTDDEADDSADDADDADETRAEVAAPAEKDEGLSKKAAFLAEKSARQDIHADDDTKIAPLTTQKSVILRNAKTQESIVVPLDLSAINATEQQTFSQFLRCRFTNTAAEMDKRLLATLVQAARKFKTSLIEIVSGYRSPKFQLMLRKKGHEVARDSEHTRGNAVDFRLPAVKTRKLLAYVKSLRLGGVGYYPQSGFVHADVGRVRYWRGH